ncbi:MAG TPA: hypothetical protein VJM31_08520 [Vicinamibacterales bacterium]|nr:hypothetical protein [Vicinamibacterales bacterium]
MRPGLWSWLAAVWLAVAAAGLAVLWAYDNAPGESATAPTRWPAATALARSHNGATLVLLAHPQCSCTRASLAELAETLARATVQPKTYVLFLKPDGFSDDWAKSDLWRTAAAIPGVTVVRDDDGVEARRFGVSTSGQTLLYDEAGTLRFSGGITGARAHQGDNDGRRAIVDLLNRGTAQRATTNVFGCALFNSRM